VFERTLSALASQVKTRVGAYANALPSLKDRLCLVTIRHQDASLVAAPADASLPIFIPEDEHTSMPSNATITRSTRLSSSPGSIARLCYALRTVLDPEIVSSICLDMKMPGQAMQVTILRTLGGMGRSLALSHADQGVNLGLGNRRLD
jgi:hypothetical protein